MQPSKDWLLQIAIVGAKSAEVMVCTRPSFRCLLEDSSPSAHRQSRKRRRSSSEERQDCRYGSIDGYPCTQ
eukprot:1127542-Amphidinium_carterae.1